MRLEAGNLDMLRLLKYRVIRQLELEKKVHMQRAGLGIQKQHHKVSLFIEGVHVGVLEVKMT
jgi:hypothetical protein